MRVLFLIFVLGFVASEFCYAERNVRVVVQLVELTKKEMDGLLEDGGAIHPEILGLVKSGGADVLDTVMITGRESERMEFFSGVEVIYPTEYNPPGYEGDIKFFYPPDRSIGGAFETKNTGVSLTIDSRIYPRNRYVSLRFEQQYVRLLRLQTWTEYRDQWGDGSLRMPIFEKWATDTNLNLEVGKTELVSVYAPQEQGPVPALPRRVMMFVRVDLVE